MSSPTLLLSSLPSSYPAFGHSAVAATPFSSFDPPSAFNAAPPPTLPLPTGFAAPTARPEGGLSPKFDSSGLADFSLSWGAASPGGALLDLVGSDALPGSEMGTLADGSEEGRIFGWDSAQSRSGGQRLEERGSAPGTDTVTTVVTITTSNYVPVDDGALTLSVYAGPHTTITLFPQTQFWTVYPTTTRFATSLITEVSVTYATATATETRYSTGLTVTQVLPTTPPTSSRSTSTPSRSSSTPSPTATRSSASQCLPEGSQQKVHGEGLFDPTPDQVTTLYAIAAYIVGITICWNLLFIRAFLYPFKSLVVAYHEFGHVLGFMIAREPLVRVIIDPNRGGATFIRPGVPHLSYTLFGGYALSSLLGGALTFSGFSGFAAKIASFFVGLSWLAVLAFQRGLMSQLSVAGSLGLMIGLWFVKHGIGLRFYILFIGVMSSFYIIFDTADDYFHAKENCCCVVVMQSHIPGTSAKRWFVYLLAISSMVFVGVVLAALAIWRQTPHDMYCQAQSFLPT